MNNSLIKDNGGKGLYALGNITLSNSQVLSNTDIGVPDHGTCVGKAFLKPSHAVGRL